MSDAGGELQQVLMLYKLKALLLMITRGCSMLVAKECQKTENVDLKKLLTAEERCAEIIKQLLEAALEQLSCTLEHHQHVFKATQNQLEGVGTSSSMVALSETGALSLFASEKGRERDEQFKRRLLAIEGTMIHCERSVSFADVAGLSQAKQTLREAIVLPIKYPHLFTGSCCPWKRLLLYGPPGTGKTRLAQAVSGEVDATFYCVSSSDLISSWVGESEKIIKDLFSHAKKRNKAVVFIDEIDSICRQRHSQEEEHTRRVKTELLRQMEGADFETGSSGCSKDVFLLCATNCPWELDPAFLRRFQRRIYIPLPNREARYEMIEHRLGSTQFSDEDWDSILLKTEGYSGSDLDICVTDALLQPVRELEQATHWRAATEDSGSILYTPCAEDEHGARECVLDDLPSHQVYPRKLRSCDLVGAISRCGQSIRKADLERYTEFTNSFGQVG